MQIVCSTHTHTHIFFFSPTDMPVPQTPSIIVGARAEVTRHAAKVSLMSVSFFSDVPLTTTASVHPAIGQQ